MTVGTATRHNPPAPAKRSVESRADRPCGKGDAVEWICASGPVPYPDALDFMSERARRIREKGAAECVWLLEHPPLYTAGTSAEESELLDSAGLPVYRIGRGGRFTYHGPGQRVAYVMLDLSQRGQDLRRLVWQLEEWGIRSLACLGVEAGRRPDRIGVWTWRNGTDAKIMAIGIRVRRWVTLHGIALNVDPDLEAFAGIVPCGIRDHGVTSLRALGLSADMAAVDAALRASFRDAFAAHPEPA